MPTYDGTLMTMVAWMPSASPAVLCGGQTSYSITSTACLVPSPPLALPRAVLDSDSGYALIPQPPMLPWKLSARTFLIWQEGAGGVGYLRSRASLQP